MKKIICLIIFLLSSSTAFGEVAGNLVVTRTSGNAPLAVFFDASGTVATGVSHPFHNLNYTWDFGDTSAGTWALTNGKDKNKATGPVASHVYETAGTYTTTVTIKDFNGNLTTQSVVITVNDFSNVICFSGSGDFTGAPAGAQHVTTNDFNTVMSYAADNTQLLLHRGETFTSAATIRSSLSGYMVGAFGSGSQPVVQATHDKNLFVLSGNDIRFVDLRFYGAGVKTSNIIKANARLENFLMMKTSVQPGTFHSGIGFGGNALDLVNLDIHNGIFVVENDWRDFGFGSGSTMMFIAAGNSAVLGNHFEDVEGGEHIIRIQHGEKFVVANNYMARQLATKQLLTIRSRNKNGTCSAACGRDTREVLVSDNIFITNADVPVQAIHKNKTTDVAHGTDLIFERNYSAMTPGKSAQLAIAVNGSASYVTIRNNIANMNGWFSYRGFEGGTWQYNNTVYTSDTVPSKTVRAVGRSTGTAANNLLYAPNATNSTASYQAAGTQSNNLNAATNPFISASFNGPADYRLSATSAAIDAGTGVPVLYDYAQTSRPSGSSFDVGAYEYNDTGTVTGVSLNVNTVSLNLGESFQLIATLMPANTPATSASWSSNNTSVATVDASGLVTAMAQGSATITVTTADGQFTATCVVTVNPGVEIIMDNTDTSGVTTTGSTWFSSSGSGYLGDNFTVISNGIANTIRWTPDLVGKAGKYEVYVRCTDSWPKHVGTDAPYTVTHDTGATSVKVDQSLKGGTWVFIGAYSLSVGDYIELSGNLANGKRGCGDSVRLLGMGG